MQIALLSLYRGSSSLAASEEELTNGLQRDRDHNLPARLPSLCFVFGAFIIHFAAR